MRTFALAATALVAVATLSGCGGDDPQPRAAASSTSSPAVRPPAARTPETSTPTPTPTSSGSGDTVTVADSQGYEWRVTWQFSPPPPAVDIRKDPPGFASAVWDTTSATVDPVFITPGREEPAFNSLDYLHLGVLYPADGPVCALLTQGDALTGGRKGNAVLTGPTAGQFCFSPINSGYADYPGLAILKLPEAQAPAVVAALGKPSYVVLVAGGAGVTGSAGDNCTIVMEDSYGTKEVVLNSSPGPLSCAA